MRLSVFPSYQLLCIVDKMLKAWWQLSFAFLRHESEMYKTILSEYDTRQRELMVENAELRKVLQQLKKDMVSVLGSKKPSLKGDKPDDGCLKVSFLSKWI